MPTTLTANPAKVNDILYSSWGYEQTNIDFYIVTKVLGKSVKIRELGSNTVGTGFMSGETTPTQTPTGDEMLKRVNAKTDGSYTIKIASYARAYQWDGKPKYCSWWH
jgi:hypothetical protein